MAKRKTSGPESQNIATPDIVNAAHFAGAEVVMGAAFGFGIGNLVGSTVAVNLVSGPVGTTPADTWTYGKPLFMMGQYGIYTIFSTMAAWLKFGQYPIVKETAIVSLAVTAAIGIPFLIVGIVKKKRALNKLKTSDLHGSAHWAESKEIEQAGLMSAKGKIDPHTCYVGGWRDPKTGNMYYLTHSGPEHILALAPTRSGKGVGLVIPTLCAWMGSTLVHDIKGENYALTAGYRASLGQRILRFSPIERGTSCHFNPLNEIRIRTDHESADAQNIATMIVDPDGKGLNDHWTKTGFALLTGIILHVLYAKEYPEKSLRTVASILSNPEIDNVDEIFQDMKTYTHDPDGTMGWVDNQGRATKTHPGVAASAQEMINKAENEKSGVISTAMSFLSLYRDPIVALNTSKSDFTIKSLMGDAKGEKVAPTSLYLIVPPSDKDRLKPLIRLVINQVVRRLTEDMEFKDGRSVAGYQHRLLLMIDEFPSLGKLDIFAESLAFIAGYGMKAYLITQDVSQLYAAYGKDESIVSNCHVRIAYAPNKVETAEWLSKMLGQTTITMGTYSTSITGGAMPYQTGGGGGITYQARALLTVDEVMRLQGPLKNGKGEIVKAGAMITTMAGFAPIYGEQILYFLDPVFSGRAKIPAPNAIVYGINGEIIKRADEAKVTDLKTAAARAGRSVSSTSPAARQGAEGNPPASNGGTSATAPGTNKRAPNVQTAEVSTDAKLAAVDAYQAENGGGPKTKQAEYRKQDKDQTGDIV
ncbi:TRAG family protein [Acidithiobacillus ferrivorans SS3]|uniref:TRAG family protein n=1 Tax=Acidithiobacillus ferrivorans SS3 TaxID=743299 RepID=G0JLG5_9PROT|nr:type IV secretory system conjugative DNA transfer family protein [Acidithiobacillus ferrivorans]AEM46917.1 TRAG family protein [Acidithiobacillus ferrivorans SS3]OFA16520.1 TRAG family protein [Acidithiobacillus ferrivorans]